VSTLVLFETTYLFESGFSSTLHLKKKQVSEPFEPFKSVCQDMSG